MTGLDAYIAVAPWSLVISLGLWAGTDALGLAVLAWIWPTAPRPGWLRWQAALVGAALLSAVTYGLAMSQLTPLPALRIAAALLMLVGFVHAYRSIRRIWRAKFAGLGIPRTPIAILSVILFAGYILLASGPTTAADALNYHFGVAIGILDHGGFHFQPTWMHGRLAGAGEALIAFGLALGAEQFAAYVQLSGLIGVAALVFHTARAVLRDTASAATDAATDPEDRLGWLLVLALISAPVLVYLVSAQKPQLLPLSMTTLALALIVHPACRDADGRLADRLFLLVSLLVMAAWQSKFNFIVSGGLVGMLGFAAMVSKGRAPQSIAIGLAAAVAIVLPAVLWKMEVSGGGPFAVMLQPLAGPWPGAAEFESALRSQAWNERYPWSIFVPAGLGGVTGVIGIGSIALLLMRPGRDRYIWLVIAVAVLTIVIPATVSVRTSSRFLLEPLAWSLLAVALGPVAVRGWLGRAIGAAVSIQGLATLAMVLVGVSTLLPGALSPAWRDAVMRRTAQGYATFKWADSVLPADSVLVSAIPRMALAPRPTLSLDWTDHVDVRSAAALPYLQYIRARRPTHYIQFDGLSWRKGFDGCIGKLVAGPFEGRNATRNPFNAGAPFRAMIYEIRLEALPGCAGKAD